MICDLYNGYYNYKVKTISQYALILSKILGTDHNKLFGNIRNRDDFWSYNVKDYLKRYTDGVNTNKYLVKGFISNKEINSYDLYNETMSVINYFINKNILLKIDEYTNEIVLASMILKIANTLDVSTSPFVKNSNNYSTICLNEINTANKISYIHLIDDGKKQTSRLIELMKENVKRERKFFEFLTNLGSFNKYIDISKENIFLDDLKNDDNKDNTLEDSNNSILDITKENNESSNTITENIVQEENNKDNYEFPNIDLDNKKDDVILSSDKTIDNEGFWPVKDIDISVLGIDNLE